MSTAGNRVLFTTNYPMAEARRLWREGRYPGYHLFGTAQLVDAGWLVEDLPEFRPGSSRVGAAVTARLGARQAQAAVLRRARQRHVAYAADPVSYAGLAMLRSAGLWPHPVVAVVHPNVARSGVLLRALRTYDVVIALSKRIRDELVNEVGRDPRRTLWAPPGPDISFPMYAPLGHEVVVSSGKTYRDEAMLLRALAAARVPARVHTLAQAGITRQGAVEVVGRASYDVVLQDLRRASAVLIPLARTDGTYGITELNDALGLGKPVVQTQSPYLDVDLEAVGCGWRIPPGDAEAWRRVLVEIASDPAAAAERGAAGRRFAEHNWNWDHFAAAVREAVELAAGPA
jgi:glycosyltransferase involved in cell wall biosynthesis